MRKIESGFCKCKMVCLVKCVFRTNMTIKLKASISANRKMRANYRNVRRQCFHQILEHYLLLLLSICAQLAIP